MTGEKPSRESLREVKREFRGRKRAQRGMRRRPWRRRRLRVVGPEHRPGGTLAGRAKGLVTALVGLGLVALMVGGAMAVFGRPPGPPGTRVADRVPVLAPTPSAPATKRLPPGDPFQGSAVDHWPVGAAGMAPPAAKALAPYTAEQVAAAFERTTAYLKVAMLDPRVVFGRDVRPVAAMLDAQSLRGAEPTRLGNVFPRDVVQAHRDVRVNGLLASRLVDGHLVVEYRYVAVYAVKPARGGDAELVTIRRTGALLFRQPRRGRPAAPWYYGSSYTSSHSRCGWVWRDGDRSMEVWLGPAEVTASATVTSRPEPKESVNLLDPRAKEPDGCFDNTGKL